MTEELLIGIAGIMVLGVLAQWAGWYFRLPSILLLLVVGFLAGPVTHLINPDELFGDLLFPFVSLSVAVILFEGGLSLRVRELRGVGGAVRNLVSVGVLCTWVLCSVAAYYILHLDLALSVLLGAILVVTGPTVITPLLRHLRPTGRVGAVAKWEGIVNDPTGVILAVLVFEAIIATGLGHGITPALWGMAKAVAFGALLGVGGALLLVALLKNYWVPDFLQNPLSLISVLAVFTVSNVLQQESGLLAVTLMGVVLANQKSVDIKHIVEFKENLRVLLISILFIVLASRMTVSELGYLSLRGIAFLGALILIIRPVTVAISSIGAGLSWREKAFLAWLAPRGIVAAATSALFSLRLVEAGYPQAESLVPMVFLVIVGTVSIYGLTISPLARRLGMANPNPQGILMVGAHSWAREIAMVLVEEGFEVVLVDSNWRNVSTARGEGLNARYANALAPNIWDDLELSGVGYLLALTPNDEINSLSALHFSDVFGRSGVYQLSHGDDLQGVGDVYVPKHLRGRILFGAELTFDELSRRFNNGAVIKRTPITEEFDFDSFEEHYNDRAVPLFLKRDEDDLSVFATDNPPAPKPGHVLISLVYPEEKENA